MTARTLLLTLFRYKAADDDELLTGLAALAAEASSPDCRAALRVLDHAHTVDRIFIANLQKARHSYPASRSAEVPPLAKLASDIRDTDRWYIDYVSRISADELEERIDFTFTDGEHGRMSREEMLAHVITHGGYHRGEIGRLLPRIESAPFAGYLHRSDPKRRRG